VRQNSHSRNLQCYLAAFWHNITTK